MKSELTFKNHARGMDVAHALLDEDYVVMLSYEDDLLIVNYEWSEHGAYRNDVVFMQRDEYEEEFDEFREDFLESIRDDIKEGYIKSLSEI